MALLHDFTQAERSGNRNRSRRVQIAILLVVNHEGVHVHVFPAHSDLDDIRAGQPGNSRPSAPAAKWEGRMCSRLILSW